MFEYVVIGIVVATVAIPYTHIVATVASNAFFKAKFKYHQTIVSTLTEEKRVG